MTLGCILVGMGLGVLLTIGVALGLVFLLGVTLQRDQRKKFYK